MSEVKIFQAKKSQSKKDWLEYGALGRNRTPDPLVRSQVLYPSELPAHLIGNQGGIFCLLKQNKSSDTYNVNKVTLNLAEKEKC